VKVDTIKSDDFRAFIIEAVVKMQELYPNNDDPIVLFYDNAQVHRTNGVRDEVQKQKCLSILNCPYAPDLNFCEKFIRLHK
jgi:hypothetical protein